MGKTFGSFTRDPYGTVREYILRAKRQQPGSIPFVNLARIESPSCPYGPTPANFAEGDIDAWVHQFSRAIGLHSVLVIVETDKLTTIPCLPGWAKARRLRELSYEVHTMHENNPNAIVYIDAGAVDWWKPASRIAGWLRQADVAGAQGFALNTSHYDWTANEVTFGMQISRRLGGKHFVVNTSDNGWGPSAHKRSWYSPFYHKGCTPPGEGLGIRPTVKTPNSHVDAFIWSGTPGYEDGNCIGYGSGSPFTFYPRLALSLVQNANPGY